MQHRATGAQRCTQERNILIVAANSHHVTTNSHHVPKWDGNIWVITVGKAAGTTKRITIGLPEAIYEGLEGWAIEEDRPVANLAAYQLEQAVRIKYPDRFPPQIQRVDVGRATPD